MSKVCSNCNTENVDEAKFCRKCGESFLKSEQKEKISNDIHNHTIEQSNIETVLMTEDEMYEQAINELESQNVIKSIWAKSLAKSEGDTEKSNALYIDLRVKELMKEAELSIVKERKEQLLIEERKRKLELFIKKYNLNNIQRISDTKYYTSNGHILWFNGPRYWRFY